MAEYVVFNNKWFPVWRPDILQHRDEENYLYVQQLFQSTLPAAMETFKKKKKKQMCIYAG